MTNNTDTRRSALKKLGITSGAAWIAPTVATLVVPQHATATSSSSSSSSLAAITSVVVVTQGNAGEGTLRLFSTSDYSNATITNFTAGAGTVSTYSQSGYISSPSMSYFSFTASANFNVGDAFSVDVNGTTYTGTVTA